MKRTFVRSVACMTVAVFALSGCPMGGDDSTPPPPLLGAPEKPTVTSGDKQLAVSWTAVEGATAYEVWYALAPDAESPPPDPATAIRYVEAISALSLVITGLDNETFYNVWIKAKNAETTSDFSEAAKENPVTPTPLEPPPAPEILDPQPEGASIRVQWTAVPQADGYEVYYIGGAALPGTAPAQVTGGGVDSALVSALDADTIYYVWVRARNAAGVSEDSAVKSCATHKSEKAIIAFTVGNSPGTINQTDKTIHVLAPFATNLQEVAPQITLSPAATVSPASETQVDFSAGPQDFTVTAQNGTTQVYRVTVAKNAWYSFTLAWTPGEGFADPGERAFAAENPVLSKSGPNSTADIEITGSFAACEWYVDSSLKGQGAVGTTVRLDAQNYLTGSHQLDIIVYDAEGIPYAKGLSFEVKE